jgi:protein-disulfide isomerase-like protein with CxxC motif
MVRLTYYTDPACSWSWAAEPALRRLQMEFGDAARITYVMAR